MLFATASLAKVIVWAAVVAVNRNELLHPIHVGLVPRNCIQKLHWGQRVYRDISCLLIRETIRVPRKPKGYSVLLTNRGCKILRN